MWVCLFLRYIMKSTQNIKVVDLFCGIGGLTHGLLQSGLEVVAGFDFDKSCQYAYEVNNNAKFFHKDIREVTPDEINELFGDAKYKVLVGCAPCQPFSNHSNKLKKSAENDARWNLLNEFLRLIKDVKPDFISMENVPQLMKIDIFKNFVAELKALDYHVNYSLVFCPDYGLPQSRRRLVLVASKHGEIKLLPKQYSKENYRTVKDAIGRLEPLKFGEVSLKDPLHKCSSLNEINYARILASKPNGTWRDWDQSLLPECYKKDSGQSFSAVYGRMAWDKPSPTITTQFFSYGTGRFGHPEQHRALSLREGAILQGFPVGYKFTNNEEISIKTISRHIGNAVPVTLGKVVGDSIKNHLVRS